MILKILDTQIEYSNQTSEIERMFNDINEQVEATDYHLSHLVIDGEEVYDNFDEYIFNRINEINNIEVKLKTIKEFVQDLILYSEQYLNRALPEIELLADEFYNNLTNETWEKLAQLLEAVQWLVNMIETTSNGSYQPKEWEGYIQIVNQLQEELANLEEAMENQDTILIGDIIQYEVVEILKQLKQRITQTVDNEFERPETI